MCGHHAATRRMPVHTHCAFFALLSTQRAPCAPFSPPLSWPTHPRGCDRACSPSMELRALPDKPKNDDDATALLRACAAAPQLVPKKGLHGCFTPPPKILPRVVEDGGDGGEQRQLRHADRHTRALPLCSLSMYLHRQLTASSWTCVCPPFCVACRARTLHTNKRLLSSCHPRHTHTHKHPLVCPVTLRRGLPPLANPIQQRRSFPRTTNKLRSEVNQQTPHRPHHHQPHHHHHLTILPPPPFRVL
jgi:hypothetical protein